MKDSEKDSYWLSTLLASSTNLQTSAMVVKQ